MRDRYQCAEYGWEDGVDRAIERVPEEIYDADQMRAYVDADRAARATPPSLPIDFKQASEQGGWQLVPTIGARVKANYPITVLNPTEYFTVSEMRMNSDGRIAVRGEDTCWFSLQSLVSPSPHPEEGALLLGGDEGGKKEGGA
ncbi:hypothetical protein C4F17_12450 [Variovorax sp. PMC12]|nr:hypothetical protein C4F17_12450 [Variovorax sp. PMC12]